MKDESRAQPTPHPRPPATIPPEPGTVPTEANPDPAPERDEDPPEITDPRDRGAAGAPVGADNIREGRVKGLMSPPGSTKGQGQGG